MSITSVNFNLLYRSIWHFGACCLTYFQWFSVFESISSTFRPPWSIWSSVISLNTQTENAERNSNGQISCRIDDVLLELHEAIIWNTDMVFCINIYHGYYVYTDIKSSIIIMIGIPNSQDCDGIIKIQCDVKYPIWLSICSHIRFYRWLIPSGCRVVSEVLDVVKIYQCEGGTTPMVIWYFDWYILSVNDSSVAKVKTWNNVTNNTCNVSIGPIWE